MCKEEQEPPNWKPGGREGGLPAAGKCYCFFCFVSSKWFSIPLTLRVHVFALRCLRLSVRPGGKKKAKNGPDRQVELGILTFKELTETTPCKLLSAVFHLQKISMVFLTASSGVIVSWIRHSIPSTSWVLNDVLRWCWHHLKQYPALQTGHWWCYLSGFMSWIRSRNRPWHILVHSLFTHDYDLHYEST